MTKLNDTEQVILTAAARNSGTVPTRERARSKSGSRTYGAAVANLLKKGRLELAGTTRDGEYVKDGQKLTLIAPTAKLKLLRPEPLLLQSKSIRPARARSRL